MEISAGGATRCVIAIALGAVVLPGCAGTTARDAPPDGPAAIQLRVVSPTDGEHIQGSSVRVKGVVNPGTATVRVKGFEVPVQQGQFASTAKLHSGENLITIGASVPGRHDAAVSLTITRSLTEAERAALRERRRRERIRAAERRRQQRIKEAERRRARARER